MSRILLGTLASIPDLNTEDLWGDAPVLILGELDMGLPKEMESPLSATNSDPCRDPTRLLRPLGPNMGVEPLIKRSNPFSGMVTVGRSKTNDVQIRNPYLSRVHAWFSTFGGTTWHVTDNDSSNRTYLNGWEIEPRVPNPLQSGDTVSFGNLLTLFLTPSGLEETLDAYRASLLDPVDDDLDGQDTARFPL